MKLILCLALVLFSACVTRSLRVDFTCISVQRGAGVQSDCADAETWKEYIEKQSKQPREGSM